MSSCPELTYRFQKRLYISPRFSSNQNDIFHMALAHDFLTWGRQTIWGHSKQPNIFFWCYRILHLPQEIFVRCSSSSYVSQCPDVIDCCINPLLSLPPIVTCRTIPHKWCSDISCARWSICTLCDDRMFRWWSPYPVCLVCLPNQKSDETSTQWFGVVGHFCRVWLEW